MNRSTDGATFTLSNGRQEYVCLECQASEAMDLMVLREQYRNDLPADREARRVAEALRRKLKRIAPHDPRVLAAYDLRVEKKMKIRDIAATLQVSEWTVHKYLRCARP